MLIVYTLLFSAIVRATIWHPEGMPRLLDQIKLVFAGTVGRCGAVYLGVREYDSSGITVALFCLTVAVYFLSGFWRLYTIQTMTRELGGPWIGTPAQPALLRMRHYVKLSLMRYALVPAMAVFCIFILAAINAGLTVTSVP